MELTWGKRRRLIATAIGLLAVVVLVAIAAFVFVYEAPSCSDGKQNRDEVGVDCGGTQCSYLCTSQVSVPRVELVRAFTLGNNRTDALAYVWNDNKNAEARNAPYTLELYGSDGVKIVKKEGSLDLLAGSRSILFIPALTSGARIDRAFITFDTSRISWQKAESTPATLVTEGIQVTETGTPRITSVLRNDAFEAAYQVRVVATVFDPEGIAIAASQTLVPVIAARSTVPLTFTWNEPFTASIGHIEVTPLRTLP
tara:strand:+ start:553163 stop:553927 length:765 start_codon:yes stop_codon:yes gene_type:complete